MSTIIKEFDNSISEIDLINVSGGAGEVLDYYWVCPKNSTHPANYEKCDKAPLCSECGTAMEKVELHGGYNE